MKHHRGIPLSRGRAIGWMTLAIAASACKKDARPDPDPNAIPASVQINAGRVVAGFKLGTNRRDYQLPAFKISRSPVTVRQYGLCVAAGVCSTDVMTTQSCNSKTALAVLPLVARNTLDSKDAPDLPATCVRPPDAASFCSWVGGRLPTAEEWQLAARGAEPRRFATESAPLCDAHPFGPKGTSKSKCCTQSCTDIERFSVGAHPLGASPLGLEDVLLTPAELLAANSASQFPACREPYTNCLVRGASPGAIDGYVPVTMTGTISADEPTYGFRCVWEVK